MEIFAKAGFSSLWLLINSSRGLPPPSHLSWNLGVILDLSMLCPAGVSPVTPGPIPCRFFPNPSFPETARAASLAPASIPYFQRRPQGQGYIWTSLPRAGGAGSDLGLCRCFYYLGLCLPAWSRLFPNFERPRERRSPFPTKTGGAGASAMANAFFWDKSVAGQGWIIVYSLLLVMELPPRNLGSHSVRTELPMAASGS